MGFLSVDFFIDVSNRVLVVFIIYLIGLIIRYIVYVLISNNKNKRK